MRAIQCVKSWSSRFRRAAAIQRDVSRVPGTLRFYFGPDGIVTGRFLDRDEEIGVLSLASPLALGQLAAPYVIGVVGFLVGVAACALLAVVEYGAWTLVVPPRAREKQGGEAEASHGPGVANADPALPISVEASDGARLAGLWYPAEGAEPTGRTVILLHGFAEPPGSVQAPRAAFLTHRGWNVAAVDLRGYGKSDGPFASFGGREASDVRRWMDHLTEFLGSAHPLVPVLWGRSMGAAIAVRAAAGDDRVKALVLESPMVDLDAAVAVWFRKRHLPFPSLLARLVTRRAERIAGVSLTRPRLLELAPRVRCPVLMIHGAEDTLVTAAEARRLVTAFPITPGFVEVPAAGHADVVAVGGMGILEGVLSFLDARVPR